MEREKKIFRVTIAGAVVNTALLVFKFLAGVLGGSAAMIADAVHSLSDFLTDIIVIVFVKISSKPEDEDHDYGHGKYETLATVIIGAVLLAVGVLIVLNGIEKIGLFVKGETLASPGIIALIAALVSIILKEWCYRFSAKVGKEVDSQAVIANAWHHRSDALSSIGTAAGIGGAIIFGEKLSVLDPIAALIVSFFIFRTSIILIRDSASQLLEKSLPEELEDKIIEIAEGEPEVSEVHHLRTRNIGNHYAIEMHLRMPGDISLYESHLHASSIEQKLKDEFGEKTHIGIHVEPLKKDGKYVSPNNK